MKCSICGYQFERDDAIMGCKGCPFLKNCDMVQCPNCGFEELAEPKLIKTLKKWRSKKN